MINGIIIQFELLFVILIFKITCSRSWHLNLVEYLISKGMNVNIQTDDGWTLLMLGTLIINHDVKMNLII